MVHRVRALDPRDVTTHKGIPVTTVHRTLVDLADVLTPHQLANVIHEAAYRGRGRLPDARLSRPRVSTDLHGFEVAFHWPQHRLVVEIDGGGHSPRDQVLRANGYSVLRLASP